MSINNVNSSPKLDALINQNIEAFAKTGTPQGPSQAPAGGAPDGVTLRQSGSNDMAPQQRGNLGALAQLLPYNGVPPSGGGGGGGGGGPTGPGGPGGPDGSGSNLSTMFQNMASKTDQTKDLGGSTMEKQMQTLFDQSQKQMEFTLVSSAIQGVKDMNTAVAKSIKGVGSGVKDMIN
jgi:hypothetical protein